MIELKGRTIRKMMEANPGGTILEHAVRNGVDWGFSCSKGNCARCRCKVEAGMEFLSRPNEAETDRLEPEEIEQGYRLGCQARILGTGAVSAYLNTYF